jgi:hypothetical protein
MANQHLGQSVCPHCGKPLAVVWEVYRLWDVARKDDKLILAGEPPPFEGGTCEECGEWVEPSEVRS